MDNIGKRNYSAKETCSKIGVSRPTLTRLAQNRKIAYYRVGTRLLFSDEHIEQFLGAVERPASEKFSKPNDDSGHA